MPDFFDPTPEQQNVRLVDTRAIRKAEQLIESCEHCNPRDSEIPFDWILDRVPGADSTATDYVLETPAKCPRRRSDIREKTLIEEEANNRDGRKYSQVW